MSKRRLKVKPDFDFHLAGIGSSTPDYRLCWYINGEMNYDFSRKKDFESASKNQENPSYHPHYSYISGENEPALHLLGNKGSRGWLIPEERRIDYILIADGYLSKDHWLALLKSLKRLKPVEGVFDLDPEKLRSRFNLILE